MHVGQCKRHAVRAWQRPEAEARRQHKRIGLYLELGLELRLVLLGRVATALSPRITDWRGLLAGRRVIGLDGPHGVAGLLGWLAALGNQRHKRQT